MRRAEAILLQGILVGSTFEEQKVFDVMVQGDPKLATSQAAVRNLLIDRPDGGHVRLSQVADVRVGQHADRHQARGRVAQARHRGRRRAGAASRTSATTSSSAWPTCRCRWSTTRRCSTRRSPRRSTRARSIGFALAAAIAMFLLLQAALRSWRLAALAFVSLPVALAGGVLGALLLGGSVTLGVLVGLMALFGLAARNAIVLLRHFQRLEQVEDVEFDEDLVAARRQERLAPVLASTAALAAAMAPLLLMGSPRRPGDRAADGRACCCAAWSTSTALRLFVLPALYLRFETGRRRPVLESPGDGRAGRQGAGVRVRRRVVRPTPAR